MAVNPFPAYMSDIGQIDVSHYPFTSMLHAFTHLVCEVNKANVSFDLLASLKSFYPTVVIWRQCLFTIALVSLRKD